MRDVLKGMLALRLLAFVPLGLVILVLVGVSALRRGSDTLGIAILAGVPVVVAGLVLFVAVRRRAS